jgi:GntR family transcriptional regulator
LDNLFLSAGDTRPMYQQIVDQITARILAGDWSPGQALPSIRELAAGSGVSVITVKRAYEDLERAGLIQTRHGKGSVVAERPQLARDLHERALHAQLAEAAATAALLGLDRAQLQARLDAALDAAADSFPPFPISSDLPEPTP